MILPALISYYDRLAAAPDSDIAPFGFSQQKISFCVELDTRGSLVRIADAREEVEDARGKPRLLARSLVVPGQSKPPGSGVNPCLLWDNPAYMLGWNADDDTPDRTRDCFGAFRDKHLALRDEIDDDAFDAVCTFLASWDPDAFEPDDQLAEFLASFGVFRVGNAQEYVHERPSIRAWYAASIEAAEANADDLTPLTPSLISGRPARIARLHEPKIRGVWGAQTAGAALVSFNEPAFESYGKSQGDNAPVGKQDAFKYCTALNRLLSDPQRRAQVGDMTVVWWADAPDAFCAELVATMFAGTLPDDPGDDAEDAGRLLRLRDALDRISRGLLPDDDLSGMDSGFHVLGLSPNAARLSVRLWWSGPMRALLQRVAQHHADAALEPVPTRDAARPLSIHAIVRETARVHGDRPDMDTVSPTLAGELTRAVLSGGLYPRSLLDSVVRRVRTEGRVTHARAAITKACITRCRRAVARGGSFEEVPVSLNKQGPEAYQLGRLFAALEKTQADALGTIDASIRDRYFGSASATPAAVFPRLIRLSQHHMGKLDEGRKVTRERLIQEICSKLNRLPPHLNLEAQGLFQIGYYHQREDLFTARPKAEAPSEEN